MIVSSLQKDDVLINIVGATTDVIGRCAILSSNFPQANITQAMALLRINNEYINILKPHYLFAYLISKEGHKQVRQIARPTGQFNMNIKEVGSFLIPLLRFKFQTHIEKVIKESEIATNRALTIYNQADTLLLNALGMADFSPSTENVNVKSFKESFLVTGRLDAEYYQPKYEQPIEQLKSLPHNTLNKIATFSNGATPLGATYLEEGIPFLRIQNIGDNQLNIDDVVYIEPEIHNSLLQRSQLNQGDVLITITGRIGTSCVVSEDLPVGNINQHIVRLRLKDKQIQPYYLSTFLNSIGGRLQTEREAYGTTREALPYHCLEKIIVPYAPIELQNEITTTVLNAQRYNKKAKHLLMVAKRAVEIAIEQDEAAGMAYIEANIE